MARGNSLDVGFGTPTQAAFGMHDRLTDGAAPLGKNNVPVHSAMQGSAYDLNKKGAACNGMGGNDGEGAGLGSENSFGGSNYSGNYGGGY